MDWCSATWFCINHQYGVNTNFTRRDAMKNILPVIVEMVECKGKTPDQTFSFTLQRLRNKGVLKFVKRGVYCLLQPYNEEVIEKGERETNKEIKESKDEFASQINQIIAKGINWFHNEVETITLKLGDITIDY